ncbi:MAG: type II toxin-antitoxin system RelE/ParE family toxin [Pseudomonadota bacterium]
MISTGAFAWLAANPALGRPRDDIAPGSRCFAHEAPLVFYLVRTGGIDVIGIPHQAMDIPGHLNPASDDS